MKVKDIFNVYSYHQITEEEIYVSKGDIPIYTGNNDIKGYWDKEFLGSEDKYLPCISFPVKGNKGVCYVQYNRFDANNTGIIVPKEEYKLQIELEWFKYKFSKLIFSVMTNNHGVGYLNKTDIENIEFELLSAEEQNKELELYEKVELLEGKVIQTTKAIDKLLNKNIFIEDNGYEKIKLGCILKHISRNDKLSVEGIYNNCPRLGEDTIKVLSGSNEDLIYGEIIKETKNIHFLNEMQCINIITRGNAGKIRYLKRGTYATNTNSYLLYIIKDKLNEIDIKNEKDEEIYLKFLNIYLEPKLIDLSTNGDVGILSVDDILNLEIPLLKVNNGMKKIIEDYFGLIHKKTKLVDILKKINDLYSKIIINL